jgi:ATP-binding cassette subfamily C protein
MLQVYDRVLGSRSEETLAALLVLVAFLYLLLWLLEFSRSRLVARFGARFQEILEGPVFRGELTHAEEMDGPRPNSALRDLDAIQALCASPALLALFDMPFTPIFVAAIFVFHP